MLSPAPTESRKLGIHPVFAQTPLFDDVVRGGLGFISLWLVFRPRLPLCGVLGGYAHILLCRCLC
jgi:hypothetical protein